MKLKVIHELNLSFNNFGVEFCFRLALLSEQHYLVELLKELTGKVMFLLMPLYPEKDFSITMGEVAGLLKRTIVNRKTEIEEE